MLNGRIRFAGYTKMNKVNKDGLSEASLTAISIMAVDGMYVDEETLELLRKMDAGELTLEQALLEISEDCKKLTSQSSAKPFED